jgi:hypothetical protein
MTKTWGPLGWATLHSVAAVYPDNPTDSEMNLITRWIESFRMCIVCEKCKLHFTTLLAEYKAMYPDWNASRKNLSLFVLRAHNTVNIRQVSKPVLSVDEAITQLKTYLPADKAVMMRQSYIVHIRAEWSRNLSMEGVTAVKYIRELILAETEYWGNRGFSWTDIENLVRTESISPLPSREKPKFSIGVQPPRHPAPRTITGPSSKPRFSFLSR